MSDFTPETNVSGTEVAERNCRIQLLAFSCRLSADSYELFASEPRTEN